MITAIQDHSKEPNQQSAKPVADFLEACHLIFEKGLLSKRRVNSLNTPALDNIKKGMALFEKWCHKQEETGIALSYLACCFQSNKGFKLDFSY